MPDPFNYYQDPGAADALHTIGDQRDFWRSRGNVPKLLRKQYRAFRNDPMGSNIGKAFTTKLTNDRILAKQAVYDPQVAAMDPQLQQMREAVAEQRQVSSAYPGLFSALANQDNSFMDRIAQGYNIKNQGISNSYDSEAQIMANMYNKTKRKSLFDKIREGAGFASQVLGLAGGLGG